MRGNIEFQATRHTET